jgi:peptidoglycan-associated lipoprotein
VNKKRKIITALLTPFVFSTFLSSCGKKDVKAEAPVASMQMTPPPVEPAPPVDEKNDLVTVHFDVDKASLNSTAKKELKQNASWLRQKPHAKVTVKVEGHCDERGSAEYNLKLGEKRAEAVKHYLVSHGIRSKRLTVESLGKDRPLDPGHDEEAWAKNRRASFRLTGE